MPTQPLAAHDMPAAMRDLYPPAAHAVFAEAYKASMASAQQSTGGQLSAESAASRDAWEAVKRQFEEDHVTHRWHAKGQVPVAHAAPPTIFESIKRLFIRKRA